MLTNKFFFHNPSGHKLVKACVLAFFSTFLSLSGLAQNFAISGPNIVCRGVTYHYSSPYDQTNWSVSDGVVIGGTTGAGISVQWPNGYGSISASFQTQDGGECWYEPDIYPPQLQCNPINYYDYVSNTISVSEGIRGFSLSSGRFCVGGGSASITLAGSQTDVSYQLRINGSDSGAPVQGTGSQITWSGLTTVGQYVVMGTRAGCNVSVQVGNSRVDADNASGTISGSAYSCQTPLSGALTLVGYSGSIVRWEKRQAGNWEEISHTSTILNYTNIATTTEYRALVSNSCGLSYSSSATIEIYQASVAGFIAGASTPFCGVASGSLTLNNYRGYILYWEYWRLETGNGWERDVNNYSPSFPISFSEPTQVRAVLRNGTCSEVASDYVTVSVSPAPVVGTVESGSFCGSASGSLSLSELQGSVIRWESNNGSGWAAINNTSASSLPYSGVTTTTQYRVLVGSGSCAQIYSNIATITVIPSTVGGNLTGGGTFCSTASGTLSLSDQVGTIIRWESNNGNGWASINNTSSSLPYSAVTTTTQYRVLVGNGSCAQVYSSIATITVSPSTVGGNLTGDGTFCSTAGGTLSLSGQVGTVIRWESNNGSGWASIKNKSNSLPYSEITTTTEYRVLVGSGSCAQMYSSIATITIAPSTSGGNLTGGGTFCSTASGTLSLSGHVGSIIQWESNNGRGWASINNTSSSLPYSAVTTTTQYRVLVGSGSCAQVYSSIATITVSPSTVGGGLTGNGTFCSTASGTLFLRGHVGSVIQWESNNGSGWVSINNQTSSLPYSNVRSTTQYRARVGSGSCAPVYSTIATVTVGPVTVGGTVAGSGTFCATASGSLTLSGHVGSVLRWQFTDGNGWTSVNNTTNSLRYSNITTLTQYRAVVKSGGCSEVYSSIATITIDPATQGGIVSPSDGRYEYAPSASGPITLFTPHAVVRWEKNDGAGWIAIPSTASTYSYAYSVTQSTSFRAISKNGVCPQAASTEYNVYLFPAPTVNPATPQIIQLGTNILLSVNSTYYSYQWYKDSNPIAGANSQQYTATEPGNYFVQVRGSANAPLISSPPTRVKSVVGYYEKILNAVSETVVLTEGITEDASPYSLAQNQVIQTISYQDGLGRNFQTVGIGQSPLGGDLISVEAHSKHGLIDSTFLPYATTTRSGLYRPNAIRGNASPASYTTSEQYQFYQNTPKVAQDNFPFARTLYANDPTLRVTEQGAPGQDWQPGSITAHTVRSITALNDASYPVRYWKPDGTTTTNYPANSVLVTIGTDENNNKVRTYTNTLGQVVLKQVQLDETLEGVSTPWLETYYIYDQLGRLKYIVPPKAMKVLGTAASLNVKIAAVNELIHIFNYDRLGRLVEKKVPSAAWQYIVYDQFDRPVLTQDGNLFATRKWRFVKYDMYNRVVYAGIYTNTTQTTRLAVQALLDAIDYKVSPYYETEQALATHGYSNVTFPTAGTSANEILTVNYYDHYNFDRQNDDDYTYDAAHLPGQEASRSFKTRGRVTGSKRVLLSASGAVTTSWITNAIFYDKYDRPIQTQSNNHLHTAWTAATLDKNTVVYDFVKTLKSRTTHYQNATTSVTLDDRNDYDPTGRVLRSYRSINGAAEQLLVQYEYNALGQLVDKKLHEKGAASQTFLQSVDMRYNIRGWLKSINNSQLINDASVSNDETDDYFGLELVYNTSEAGLGNNQYYNGNISAAKWKAIGSAGPTDQRSYSYLYDKSDRLKSASFQANNGVGWLKEVGTLNEAVTYDHNGNIKTLLRNRNARGFSGLSVTSAPEAIDNLTYEYASDRDRLTKMEDAATATGGFTNGVNTATEYLYNTDGSLTKDDNKGIQSITYNMLGKPQVVTFSGTPTKRITYTYDAAGTKVKMATLVNNITTTTDYVAGFVYTNNSLSFFSSPEGRVVKKGTNFEYEYAIADHQGNTRVVFTSAPPVAQPTVATLEATTNAGFQNYTNRVSFDLFDHTDAGTVYKYAQKLTGGLNAQVGLTKTYSVMAGDKVKVEAFAKYFNPRATGSNLGGFATALASAFGVNPASTGEALKAFNGLANYGNMVAAGTARTDNGFPKLFVNILLFDKNYVLIDAAWQQIDGGEQPVGSSTKLPHAYLSAELTAKEPGFAYLYISNESATLVDGYFDDVTMTHTPTNIVQYNEYYPFGLQTATSWARPTATGNNFLANGGTELNTTSSLYDLEYRSYDPVLGRMNGVDPMATKYASLSPYNFSFNDPVSFTDVTGADPLSDFLASSRAMEKWFDETMPSAMDYNGNGGWGGGAGYNSMMGGYGTAGYVGEYSLGGLIGSYNSNYGGPVYVNSGGATGHFASPTQLAWAQRQESEPLNATIEYDRNKYERVRLEVSNGIVAGYEVFWTPAMRNLVASLNSFALAQGQNEWQIINTQYGSDFYGKFGFQVGLFDPRMSMSDVEALIRFRMDKYLANELLHDKDRLGPDMEVVGYEIFKDYDIGKGRSSNVLYEVIPKAQWNEPVYRNPGMINEDNGRSNPIFNPVKDGTLYLTIFFQYIRTTIF